MGTPRGGQGAQKPPKQLGLAGKNPKNMRYQLESSPSWYLCSEEDWLSLGEKIIFLKGGSFVLILGQTFFSLFSHIFY